MKKSVQILMVALILFCSGCSEISSQTSGGLMGVDIGEIRFKNYSTSLVEKTLIGDHAPGEDIKGYKKYEQTDGDIRFICYANTTNCDIMPSLLIYTEYLGDGFVNSESVLHVDNIEWNEKEYDTFEIISEDKCSWFSIDNFYITGSMKFTQTVSANNGNFSGVCDINIQDLFAPAESVSSTAE